MGMNDGLSEEEKILMIIAKIASMVIIFLVEFIAGIIPIRSKTMKSNIVIMGCVNSFVAGVFLGFGLMDLLPGAIIIFEEHLLKYDEEGNPLPLFP